MGRQNPTPKSTEISFPGESNEYRAARNELLQAEIQLRRQIEAVAQMRRELPLGGAVPEDYLFEEAELREGEVVSGGLVKLSELFRRPEASLFLYSFMYGPKMAAPCPSCTSIIDGLDGQAPHINQRINFAVVMRSPMDRILKFAKERGWRDVHLLSSEKNSYNQSYFGELADGSQMPVANLFVKKNGQVFHTWASELAFAPSDPGQDPRHVDMFWPIWNVFDLTSEGRGTDWRPKLQY